MTTLLDGADDAYTFDAATVARELVRPSTHALVARVIHGTVVAGAVVFDVANDAGHLGYLLLASTFRGRSAFGSALLAAYERHVAHAYGVRRVRVDALLEPACVAAWYVEHGYWRPPADADADVDGELVCGRAPSGVRARPALYVRSGVGVTGTHFREIDVFESESSSPPLELPLTLDVDVALRLLSRAERRRLLRTQCARNAHERPWHERVLVAALNAVDDGGDLRTGARAARALRRLQALGAVHFTSPTFAAALASFDQRTPTT